MAELPFHKSMPGNEGESLAFLSLPTKNCRRENNFNSSGRTLSSPEEELPRSEEAASLDDFHATFCSPAGPHQFSPRTALLRPSQWPLLGGRKSKPRARGSSMFSPLQETLLA